MTILGSISGGISGGIQILPVDLLDKVTLDIAAWAVSEYIKKVGIEATLVAVVSGTVEIGPNGKTYSLKLKLKVKVGDAYVLKIFQVVVFAPFLGIPTAVSFDYVEDVSI